MSFLVCRGAVPHPQGPSCAFPVRRMLFRTRGPARCAREAGFGGRREGRRLTRNAITAGGGRSEVRWRETPAGRGRTGLARTSRGTPRLRPLRGLFERVGRGAGGASGQKREFRSKAPSPPPARIPPSGGAPSPPAPAFRAPPSTPSSAHHLPHRFPCITLHIVYRASPSS